MHRHNVEITCKQDMEYLAYIREHVANVNKVFFEKGIALCKELNLGIMEYVRAEANIRRHDDSKYSDQEFRYYRMNFYPDPSDTLPKKDIKALFDIAWKHHYTYNKHHWDHWVKGGEPKEMDNISIIEMLCDWGAMSIKFGGTAYGWYLDQMKQNKIILHPNTKVKVELLLSKYFA